MFATWLRDRVERSMISKRRLAAAIGHDTTAHINKFLAGALLPMPETLRTLCDAMGAPYLTACANAGYYTEVLWALSDLEALGHAWRREDNTYPTEALEYRSLCVLKVNDVLITQAIQDLRIAARYQVGIYEAADLPVDYDENMSPESIAWHEHRRKFESRQTPFFVPTPHAVAILIAVAGFPRRGDIYKDGCATYAAELLESTEPLTEVARKQTRRPRVLPQLLRRANDILFDNTVTLDSRRVIAAEYIVHWADLINYGYTRYARLATHAYFGVAGSSESTITPEVQLPQILVASRPDPSVFKAIAT